jgi:hypothetical protein
MCGIMSPGGNYGINASTGGVKTNYDFVVNNGGGTVANYWARLRSAAPKSVYMFGENSTTRVADITDGASNTLAMGETTYANWNGDGTPWAYRAWAASGIEAAEPINDWLWPHNNDPVIPGLAASWSVPSSLHTGGCNFICADGSVHFISQNTSTGVMTQLSTVAGGEVVEAALPW